MREPRAIVVVAPNWLGDAVMALPAVAALRRRHPAARFAVAARPAVSGLFPMVPGVDVVIEVTGRGIVGRGERAHDVARLRALQADVAVLLPNSFSSAWLVRAAGIAERWGYARDWRRPLLTRAVRRPRRRMHQGEYYQSLVRALGYETGPLEPAIVVPASALEEARRRLVAGGWDPARPLVVFAPGAAYGTAKRWPPEHFAELATRLTAAHGAHVALVGSAADRETTAEVSRRAPATGLMDLAGGTTLEQLAGVLAQSRVCVSNDSGVMHLAAAAGVHVAAIFGPTREAETAPLVKADRRAAIVFNQVWCRPCMLRNCPIGHRCMQGLAPARVLDVVQTLMEES